MKTIIVIAAVAVLSQVTVRADTQFGEGLFGLNFFPFGASFDGQASASVSANVVNPFETIDVSDAEYNNEFNVIEQLGALFRSGAEAIAKSVSQVIQERVHSAAQYGRVLISYMAALKDEIEFSGAQREFNNLERNLRGISNEAEQLATLVSKLRETRRDQIIEAENNHAEDSAEWSNLLLEILDSRTNENEWAHIEAEKIINDFIQRNFDLQDSCKEEALGELDDFERNVRTPLDNIEKIQYGLVPKLRACASSTNNRVQQRRCKRDISSISTKLSTATRDLRELSRTGQKLNNIREQYKNRDCVKETSLEYNLEKFNIETSVEDLISQASSHPNPTNSNQGGNNGQPDNNQNTNQGSGQTSSGQNNAQSNDNQSTSQGSGQTSNEQNNAQPDNNQSANQGGGQTSVDQNNAEPDNNQNTNQGSGQTSNEQNNAQPDNNQSSNQGSGETNNEQNNAEQANNQNTETQG